MVALNSVLSAGIQQSGGSHYVGSRKTCRVLDGAVHMALRRKVYDNIRLLRLKQVKYKLPVRNIPADKLVIGGVLHLRQVLQVSRIGQKIQVDDLMLSDISLPYGLQNWNR